MGYNTVYMKTLTELNGKWWYRLIKILYGITFFIVVIGSAIIVYNKNGSYLASDWRVSCIYGNHESFNVFYDKGISTSDFDPNKAVPSNMDSQIKSVCNITQTDVERAQKDANDRVVKNRTKNHCTSNDTEGIRGLLCGISYSAETYKIWTTKVAIPTPWKAMGYAALDIFFFLGFFEAIRRAFYYTVFGKINPLK